MDGADIFLTAVPLAVPVVPLAVQWQWQRLRPHRF